MTDPRHPDVTGVVVTWRGRDLIDNCLDALVASGPARIVVVDNGSDDGTAELLHRRGDVEVVRLDRNQGFAGGVAAGLGFVSTALVALVNDDAEVAPDWLDHVRGALDDDVAAVQAKLVLPDGRINNAGSAVTPDGAGYDRGLGEPDDGRWDDPRDLAAVCGGGVVLRTDAVRAVGGFEPSFFLYYEDTDLSFRLRRAGWRLRYEPRARIVHRHSASADQTSTAFHRWNERNRLLFVARNFPAAEARQQWWRYARSIVGFAGRRLRGRPVEHPTQHLGLRLRVLAEALVRLPSALRARRRITRLGPFPGTEVGRS